MSAGSRLSAESRIVFLETLRGSLGKPGVLNLLQYEFTLCAQALVAQGYTMGAVETVISSDLGDLVWLTLAAPVSAYGEPVDEAALQLKVEVLVLARLEDNGSARGIQAQVRAQRIWRVVRKNDPDKRALSCYEFSNTLEVEYVEKPADLVSIATCAIRDQYQRLDERLRLERSHRLASYLNEALTP